MAQASEQAKIEILKYLSFKCDPVKLTELHKAVKSHFSSAASLNRCLDEMTKRYEIIEITPLRSKVQYMIPTYKALDYLWDITKSEATYYKRIATEHDYSYTWSYTRLNLQMQLISWHTKGQAPKYDFYRVSNLGQASMLLRFIPFHNKWRSIMSHLDTPLLQAVIEQSHISTYMLLDPDQIKLFQEKVVSFECADKLSQLMLRSVNALYTNILSGKLRETEISEYDSSHNLALRAVLHQYAGERAKAVALYRKVIKAESRDSELITNPLFSLLYIMALERDMKQSSQNRLDKVLKYTHNENEPQQLAARIYIDFITENYTKLPLQYLNDNWASLPPLSLVLAVIVVLHYNIGEVNPKAIAAAEQHIDYDDFLLLQLEASASLPKYKAKREELISRLGFKPILEPHVVLEPWQKSLNELSSILDSNTNKATKESSSTDDKKSRITYLISQHDHIQPRLQKRLSSGAWSSGRNIALSTMASNAVDGMESVDKEVASCIKCYDSWSGRTYSLSGNSVFKALINHPLVFSAENPDLAISIVSDTPHLRVESHKGGYRVTSNLKLDGINNTIVKRESDLSFRVFSLTSPQRKIISIFEKQNIFPASAREQLAQLVVDAAPIITVHSDIVAKSENLKSIKGSARITVQLIPISEGLKMELFAKPIEDAAQYLKPSKGEESIIALIDGESVLVGRDLKKEARNLKTVKSIIIDKTHEEKVDDVVLFDDIYDTLELIEALQEVEKIARIEWPKGARIKIRGAVDFPKLNLSLRSRAGWFEVDGSVKVNRDIQLSLAELLEKLRSGGNGRFVELTKGEFISLSDSLRKQLSELEASSSQGKKGIQISKFASSIVSDLESGGAKISKDKAFEELQQRIIAADNITITTPTTLQAELRDYQTDGYKWMARLAEWGAGACLADDMGLGKTVQSIALLLSRAEQGASLIVAPASVVHNWQSELQRFAPTLSCRVLHDNIAEREEIIASAAPYEVVITTYGLLGRITDLITPKEWNVILLDEAHNIKNRDTKSSKVAMSLSGKFRLMLTGTPIQNHLGEIWNLFNFTNPGLLGSFDHFSQKFITPIEQNNDKVRQRELKRLLQPFMLRRTKSEVLDELPTKTEIIHRVELSEAERALYEGIRESAVEAMESGELNPIQSLAEITKLRQAACHPALLAEDLSLPSAKVNRFIELATELIENRHRALVFSQFTSFLSHIKRALDERGIPYLYLDGATPIKEREKRVNSFQQGETPIFLISLKAGGTGLNLTAADYVIHLDPWWNPAIEDQASDRSHRIGQTRAVTIYRLIAQDTIEEKIIELHKSKKSLADSLLEGSNMSHKLSREDMLALLRGNVR